MVKRRQVDGLRHAAAVALAARDLELLELGGPEAVTEQLAQFPSGQRKEFVRTVLSSGFPVRETLEEFRTLVAAPILHGTPRPHPTHVTRTQRTRPKRPRRH
jgi:hypothetical protein